MFKRAPHAEGLTNRQRAMLERYETVRRSNDLRALLALNERPKRQVVELAAALDESGTPAERETFIDAERSVLSNVIGVSLMALPDVRTALAREAVQGWPLVRHMPAFAAMEHGMRAAGSGDDVFERGTFISSDTASAMVIWLSAFGGPVPISLMDMTTEMTCVAAFGWIQTAMYTFNRHVSLIRLAQRNCGRVQLPNGRPGPGLDFTFTF